MCVANFDGGRPDTESSQQIIRFFFAFKTRNTNESVRYTVMRARGNKKSEILNTGRDLAGEAAQVEVILDVILVHLAKELVTLQNTRRNDAIVTLSR